MPGREREREKERESVCVSACGGTVFTGAILGAWMVSFIESAGPHKSPVDAHLRRRGIFTH